MFRSPYKKRINLQYKKTKHPKRTDQKLGGKPNENKKHPTGKFHTVFKRQQTKQEINHKKTFRFSVFQRHKFFSVSTKRRQYFHAKKQVL